MGERESVLDAVRRNFQSEARIAVGTDGIRMDFSDGVLTLEGEVETIAGKRLALERAAVLPEVRGIVDRLLVRPAVAMGDREIADHVRDALLQESAFADCAITVTRGTGRDVIRDPDLPAGSIEVDVADGVVTLNGELVSLGRKRLAGVLAWWVPGSRDVVNGIAVVPEEADSPDAVEEAVRVVLEKDPFVDATQIRVGARHAVVRLTGTVPTASEREMAEFDAWFVFGVDDVVNNISVRA
jgi:osmotically-inducible protein OsmY